MLERLQLEQFKSFEHLDLRLKGPVAVLFGPNASGKSNLLDALQLLSRLVTSERVAQAFRPPFRGTALESVRWGFSDAADLAPTAEFVITVDVRLAPHVVQWVEEQRRSLAPEGSAGAPAFTRHRLRYTVRVQVARDTGQPVIADEQAVALDNEGRDQGQLRLLYGDLRTHVGERIYHCRDEAQHAAPMVHTGGRESVLAGPLSAWHVPHLVALRAELSRYRFFAPNPRGAVRERSPVQPATRVDPDGAELVPYLNTLKHERPLQFESLVGSLQLLLPSVTGLDTRPTQTGELELWLCDDGQWVPGRLASDGTLRLLTLLATISQPDDPPTLVGFEEPESGIHPRRIALVAEFLRTQAALADATWIVTTHSPVLPEWLPEDFLYVCRREGGQSVVKSFSEVDPAQRRGQVAGALDRPPLGERIRRGDFDA